MEGGLDNRWARHWTEKHEKAIRGDWLLPVLADPAAGVLGARGGDGGELLVSRKWNLCDTVAPSRKSRPRPDRITRGGLKIYLSHVLLRAMLSQKALRFCSSSS